MDMNNQRGTHLSSGKSLDVEGSVRNFFASVLDVHLVLAKIVGRVGGFKGSVAIVRYFYFARISIWTLQFFLFNVKINNL